MLSALLALLLQAAPAEPPETDFNLTMAIDLASSDASGGSYCAGRRASQRYEREFQRRFGARIRRLLEYHKQMRGPDGDYVNVGDCSPISRLSQQEQDRQHLWDMQRFADQLRQWERQFGPPRSDQHSVQGR